MPAATYGVSTYVVLMKYSAVAWTVVSDESTSTFPGAMSNTCPSSPSTANCDVSGNAAAPLIVSDGLASASSTRPNAPERSQVSRCSGGCACAASGNEASRTVARIRTGAIRKRIVVSPSVEDREKAPQGPWVFTLGSRKKVLYQPTFRPLFCSSSHVLSGAK